MSDSPPDWVTDGPSAPPSGATGGAPAQGRGYRRDQDAASPDELRAMAAEFAHWIKQPATRKQLSKLLPDYIDLPSFTLAATVAVSKNNALLDPRYRDSLFDAVMDAANSGIRPDGKHGALIPRYDSQARRYRIVFQPMYQGIVMLGRRTGAIKNITTGIIFRGEDYEIGGGDNPFIRHVINPEIVDEAYAAMNTHKSGKEVVTNTLAFMERVLMSYCVIHGTDDQLYRAWMTRKRLEAIRLSAAAGGPWAGPFLDEMIKKSPIHLAAKLIDLDTDNPATERFRAAVLDGIAIDVTDQRALPAPSGRKQAALASPAPLDKLQTMEAMFGPQKETVAREEAPKPEPRRAAPKKEAAAEPAKEEPKPEPDNTKPPVEFKTLKAFHEYCMKALGGMTTLAEIEAFEAQPWYQVAIEKVRETKLEAAHTIEDAVEDRKTFVAQLPKKEGT